MRQFLFLITFAFLTSTAVAQEETSSFTFGGDSFLAGPDVTLDTVGTDDLFIVGETVEVLSDITGSAHAAGRRVSLEADIGQDVYAAGVDITITGTVAGDAALAGYEIDIRGPIGGDLRAAGKQVTLDAPVTGYALISGDVIMLNSTIAGDVGLTAKDIEFGPGARISGKLTLYEETLGALDVPGSVAGADRVERVQIAQWDEGDWHVAKVFDWRRAVGGFLVGVAVVAAIAALIAALAPKRLAAMRAGTLAAPFRTIGVGFVAQSAIIGSSILFAMTIVGIVVVPATILLALVAGFLGYIVGAYSFGVGLLMLVGQAEPASIGARVIAAILGALMAGLIGLVPFFGWIFVLGLVLAGIGAIVNHLRRPALPTKG